MGAGVNRPVRGARHRPPGPFNIADFVKRAIARPNVAEAAPRKSLQINPFHHPW